MDTIVGGLIHLSRRDLGIVLILASAACGDSAVETRDVGDLSAAWQLTTTVTSNTCESSEGDTNTERIILISCGADVSVIEESGLWGSGSITGDRLDFTGTEVQVDETGCSATRRSSGSLSGTSTLLEGTLSTQVTFDPASCGARPACSIERGARIASPVPYRTSCMGRDEFGDPALSEYVLPWPAGESYGLNNSYCVPYGGHREQQAYDFLIPVGDPIVAARSGVVRQVKQDSPDDGQGSDHNHAMVEHDDGTVGFYAHLKQNGVLVAVGESVQAGQTIALAGHSGTSDVVHLHFGVYDSWPPTEGQDRAVNFRNAQGPLDCRGGLVDGATYTATN